MIPLQLKEWRQKHHLTQTLAAIKLGCSTSQYKRWEAGDWPIPIIVSQYIGLENAIEIMEFICPTCQGGIAITRNNDGDFETKKKE